MTQEGPAILGIAASEGGSSHERSADQRLADAFGALSGSGRVASDGSTVLVPVAYMEKTMTSVGSTSVRPEAGAAVCARRPEPRLDRTNAPVDADLAAASATVRSRRVDSAGAGAQCRLRPECPRDPVTWSLSADAASDATSHSIWWRMLFARPGPDLT